MNIEQARVLRDALTNEIAKAEIVGDTELDLLQHLQALDNEARTELQAAIDAAQANAAGAKAGG